MRKIPCDFYICKSKLLCKCSSFESKSQALSRRAMRSITADEPRSSRGSHRKRSFYFLILLDKRKKLHSPFNFATEKLEVFYENLFCVILGKAKNKRKRGI